MAYKLRCSFNAHKKDIRCLTPQGDGESFVSGSRDTTAVLWTPNSDSIDFTKAITMIGHSGYVSSVCVMTPSDKYPQGLILTGSQDNMILGYTPQSTEPLLKMEGHQDTVCALTSGKFGTVLSGSWDKLAKVWLGEKCVMTLEGHEAAVWAVAILGDKGYMLTGSADKTIRLWRAGKCEKSFKGHTDCVRDLAVINSSEFLSCSNDATVRHWSLTGECMETYYSHSNYIYSIFMLQNGMDFVTSSEDRTLRVWRNGQCSQTITHPAQSVWSVCCLSNGDIVTGSSDGVVRVFSCDETRVAGEDVQECFNQEVAASSIPTQIGDLKTEELPGPQLLLQPGKHDGQTVMVSDNGVVEAHQWDAAKFLWIKVGNVVGASSDNTGSTTLFEGKEYDYVFSVDIEEGKPPLKLPYNKTEDPWFAAQQFLDKHQLSQMFLDQVAKFIMDNTKVEERTPHRITNPDPFTGTSDPVIDTERNPQYIPLRSYLTFDQANIAGLAGKISEFNSLMDPSLKVDESACTLDDMQSFVNGEIPSHQHIDILWKGLQWPIDQVFPWLDLLRLFIRLKPVNEFFCNKKDGPNFITHLISLCGPDSPAANQLLILRVLCNAFKHESGEQLLVDNQVEVTSCMNLCKDTKNKNIHIALSSLFLNYAVYLNKHGGVDTVEEKSHCLLSAVTLTEVVTDPEASFRLLICIGTLVDGDDNSKSLAQSEQVLSFTKKMTVSSKPEKVRECAKHLLKLLTVI